MQYRVIPFAFNSYLSVTDIIDNQENGILIPPFDINIYSSSLVGMMNNETLRKQMKREAWLKARIFAINEVGERWNKLFYTLSS